MFVLEVYYTYKKTSLQSLEPCADVSDATVRVDARSPLSLVLTIAASLDYVLFLCLRAARPCLRVHKLTHTRVHSCYRLLTVRRLFSCGFSQIPRGFLVLLNLIRVMVARGIPYSTTLC